MSQAQQSWPRKELNASEPETGSQPVEDSHTESSEPYFTIPMNKGSKKYTLREAFDTWFENKDRILSEIPPSATNSESYKVSKPESLYHLDLERQQIPAPEEHSNGTVPDQTYPIKSNILPPNLVKQPTAENGQQSFPQLVQSAEISWVYLDPAGNEQGPFNGDLMQEWLTSGYLNFELQIRRKESSEFQTLQQFCERVNNYVQPFKVPLPAIQPNAQVNSVPQVSSLDLNFGSGAANPGAGLGSGNSFSSTNVGAGTQAGSFGSNLYSQLLPNGGLGAANIRTSSSNHLFDFMGSDDYLMNQQFNPSSQFGMDSRSQPMAGGFGQLHMPSLLQHQMQAQQPPLSRSNSGWGVDSPIQGGMPAPAANMSPAPLSMGQGINQSGLGQSGTMSPWMNRVSSMSRVSSPFVPSATLNDGNGEQGDTVLSDLHSSMVTGILNDAPKHDENAFQAAPEQSFAQPEPEPYTEQAYETQPEQAQVQQNQQIPQQAPKIPQKAEETPKNVPEAREPVAESEPEHTAEPTYTVEVEVNNSSKGEEVKVLKTELAQPEAPGKPLVAPWAAQNPKTSDAPAVTLKQIQELEAERLQRQKQLRAEMRQEAALAEALAASKLEDKPQEKLTFNWGNSTEAPVAKKTLAEIQREEEAEAAKLRANKAVPKASLATTLASNVAAAPKPESTSAWTVVAPKKAPVKKPVLQSGLSYSSAAGMTTPQTLRSVSSTVVPSNSSNSHAAREELMVWARSAMTNLYPSVSKDELLEVFTTLPLHGDSAQLISETVYSSSATMDGRRFAQEFLKKRQQVEKQVGAGDSFSWTAAIASSADKVPTVDDEGWSTSSKSKKKGKAY